MHLPTPTTPIFYSASTPAPTSPPATTDSKIALWIICLLFGLVVLCIFVEHLKGMDPLIGIHVVAVSFRKLRTEVRYALLHEILVKVDDAVSFVSYATRACIPHGASA